MPRRSTSLSNAAGSAIDREIDSKYDNVKIVADNIDAITSAVDSIGSISGVYPYVDSIAEVAPHVDAVVTVSGSIDGINTVSSNIGSITAVSGSITDVNSVASDLDDVTIVARDLEGTALYSVDLGRITDPVETEIVPSDSYIRVVAENIDDVNTVASTIVPNMAEILAADDNAVIATTKAQEASDSADASAVSANEALISAGNSLTSAGNALTSENEAGLSQWEAEAAKQTAISYAGEAVGFAQDVSSDGDGTYTSVDSTIKSAKQYAEDAQASELGATNAQTASESARDAAELAQSIVETIYDTFDDRFLGSKTSAPSLDNDGEALVDGAMYFDTTTNGLHVYDLSGAQWISIPSLHLSNLLDVTLTSLSTGDILKWTGTQWENSSLQGEITNNSDVVANTAVRHDHTNKSELDTVDQNIGTGDTVEFAGVNVGGPGAITWNADDSTVDVPLNAEVTLQSGEEVLNYVRNGTGSTITNGTVVMATGTLGSSGRILVGPHSGTFTDAVRIIGVATQDILPGADGFVTSYGKIRGLDTTTWNEGDILYVTPNNAGALTNVTPTDTETSMPIAFVVSSKNNGTIMVRVTGFDMNHYKAWVQDKLDIMYAELDLKLQQSEANALAFSVALG